ncbi:MAG: 3-deoxy-manno-octulosonate cytidylyltransferase [Nitrospinae bacterium]|nr:3-deoxy-manno-octulosonate cytidylyltransferase [Nitrospinota bacterium]
MPTERKAAAIVPARWASTRFPGKPLALIRGKPMVQWVVEKAKAASLISSVIVATDDRRIYDAVRAFGGEAAMTSGGHPTGTDRVAEVAASLDCDIVVNVQGDEPLIPPENIDLAVQPLLKDPALKVSTLMMRIEDPEEIFNPNVVKVVVDDRGFALYFSRAPIPFNRDGWSGVYPGKLDRLSKTGFHNAYKHIGLYAYAKSFLMEFSRLRPSSLETIERLEQLRILSNGIPIKATETRKSSVGVDCPEDLVKVERLLGELVS